MWRFFLLVYERMRDEEEDLVENIFDKFYYEGELGMG